MATRLFPQAAFAEDQKYSHTILIEHVLHRGFSAGALIGAALGPAVYRYQQRQITGGKLPAAAAAAIGRLTLGDTVLRSAGRGAVVGTAVLAVILAARMYGRERVEWQDRSWRLLANGRQVLVDDFSVAGAVAGLATGFMPGAASVGWRGPVARAGLGSLAGTAVYLVYQYSGLFKKAADKEQKA